MTIAPLLPPRALTVEGKPRHVGVEIEFSGLNCDAAAVEVVDLFGGTVTEREAFDYRVRDTRLGDFTLALDWSVAHPAKRKHRSEPEQSLGKAVERNLRYALGSVGDAVMPVEVTSPPLPIEQLGELDRLVEGLRRRGAMGSRDHPLHAFGLQFNPELAAREADYLADHLKAFLLIEPWLRKASGIDPSRRLSTFIGHFPTDYLRKVVDPAYRPNLVQLIDDYLEASPTRNRSLDLLPAFADIDPQRVRDRVPDHRVKARPTFHYRLPDSRVSDPDWTIVADWNRWVEVERLAADRPRLDSIGQAFLEAPTGNSQSDWADRIQRWCVQWSNDR